jgi:hypothetical protein
MASQIGLSESAAYHGLAANEDFHHGGMMSFATDNGLEIDASVRFPPLFSSTVDLGD